MFPETFKDEAQVLLVLLRSGTGDEDIIYVCITEVQTSEHLVDEPLKGLCCIPQAEWHAAELKQTKRAVFGMSSDSTGIWWYARTRSNLVKIVAP